MWISKEKYQALKQLAKDNERDAETFRDIMCRMQACSAIKHEDFIVIKPKVFHDILDKIDRDEEKYKDLAAELEWYKVKYSERQMSDRNDYCEGAKDFVKWLLTNDKYAACTIDTDEECVLCEVGLTKDMWTESSDELFKQFIGEKL